MFHSLCAYAKALSLHGRENSLPAAIKLRQLVHRLSQMQRGFQLKLRFE
jgi:hypothetical protein